jgi:hypothetical protein
LRIWRCPIAAKADLDIRQHPRPRQQPRFLKHHTGVFGACLFAEADGTGVDGFQPRDQTQQRAFAATAAADNRDKLSRGNVQVDTAKHLVVAERLAQATNGQRQSARGAFRTALHQPGLLDEIRAVHGFAVRR